MQIKSLLVAGFAAKLFYDEMDADLNALDLASPLLIFNGVLTGHTRCHAGPIGCGKEAEVSDGKYQTPRGRSVAAPRTMPSTSRAWRSPITIPGPS